MRATTLCTVLTLAAPLLLTTTTGATISAKKTGGWATVAVTSDNSQILLDALSGGDAGYDQEGVGATRVCFNSIKKIEQQVVAGMNYRFHIEGCKVSSTKLAGSCAASNDKETKCATPVQYVVKVFEQTWSDTLQVKNITKEKASTTDANVSGDADVVPASVKASPADDTETQEATTAAMSDEEKRQVDKWIAANDLNEFGDSKHVMYTGGTPLFNESTGETIDRYDYILGKHPDRPWKTQAVLRSNLLAVADESEKIGDTKSAGPRAAHGLMSVIVSVGVLTVVVALVAGVKAKRTRRHFAYDSVRNRELSLNLAPTPTHTRHTHERRPQMPSTHLHKASVVDRTMASPSKCSVHKPLFDSPSKYGVHHTIATYTPTETRFQWQNSTNSTDALYKLPTSIGTGPKKGFGTSTRDDWDSTKKLVNPCVGPGSYESINSCGRQPSSGCRSSGITAFDNASRTSLNGDSTPSPGPIYNLPEAIGSNFAASPKFGTSKRQPLNGKSESPGPNVALRGAFNECRPMVSPTFGTERRLRATPSSSLSSPGPIYDLTPTGFKTGGKTSFSHAKRF